MLRYFTILFMCVEFVCHSQLKITEMLIDPPSDLSGDANQDGERSSSGDEFVEILNVSDSTVDISGWKVYDAISLRHTFSENTMLESFESIVVFGALPESHNFEGQVLAASEGSLSFNNTGDSVYILDAKGEQVDYLSYSSSLGQDESIVKDITTNELDNHSNVYSGMVFSPGKDGDVEFSSTVTSLNDVDVEPVTASLIIYDLLGNIVYEGVEDLLDISEICVSNQVYVFRRGTDVTKVLLIDE